MKFFSLLAMLPFLALTHESSAAAAGFSAEPLFEEGLDLPAMPLDT